MDPDESLMANAWRELSSSVSGQHPFIDFTTRQQNQGGVDFLNFGAVFESQHSELRSAEILSSFAGEPSSQTHTSGNDGPEIPKSNDARDWDPNGMLDSLSFLEQKIHQLQEMVHLIIARRSQAGSQSDEILGQQQLLITADLTSIIVQLLSTAGSLLPSMKNSPSAVTPQVDQVGQSSGPLIPPAVTPKAEQLGQSGGSSIPPAAKVENVADQSNEMDTNTPANEHEGNDEEGDDGENLPPGSYEILQLEKEEILAPHTHFCTVCGKGFKRDANLRMHMRGHGEVYKTTAALARPDRYEPPSDPSLVKRYSCPFLGCKRNKDHNKFQPLKTILCVKNHYKRTHCDKSYVCSRCHTKRFSVIADLKTHEKHCGRDRWICSCGTTFSRKDKLLGHISLFQEGHAPAIPLDDPPNPAFFTPAVPSDDPLPARGPSPWPPDAAAFQSDNIFREPIPPRGPSDGPPDAAAFRSEASSDHSFREPIPFSPLSYDSSEFPAAFARPVCDDTAISFSFPSSFS